MLLLFLENYLDINSDQSKRRKKIENLRKRTVELDRFNTLSKDEQNIKKILKKQEASIIKNSKNEIKQQQLENAKRLLNNDDSDSDDDNDNE